MRELRGARPAGDIGEDSPTESLSLRVLGHLAMLINSRPFLKRFEIIPVETNHSNKSPIVIVEQDLGLESWCVKHIYNYAYKKLTDEYISKKCSKKVNQSNVEVVDALLMGVLLINPDIATLWNKRKEMVVENLLSYNREMKFTRMVLSHKYKCNEVFAYRKWLLKQVFCDSFLPLFAVRDTINEELDVIDNCAEKCSNNYHAWSHRIWLMKQIHTNNICNRSASQIYTCELVESDKWLSTHISDYSGLHYRQFCITNLLSPEAYSSDTDCLLNEKYKNPLIQFLTSNLPNVELPLINDNFDVRKLANLVLGSVMETDDNKHQRACSNMSRLIYELKLNEDMSRLYSSHESLWCHRRFVSQQLVMLIFDYFGENKPKLNNSYSELNERHVSIGSTGNIISTFKNMQSNTINDQIIFGKEPKILKCDNHSIYNSLLYKALITNERKYIDERSKAGDQFARRYESWLRIILNICI